MDLKSLRDENQIIDLFCSLAQIPSPSLKEEKVASKIIQICEKAGISVKKDDFGNVLINIPATDSCKKPLLLSSHMDVVGDDSPVNIFLNGDIIETDKTRTLGADDKAGITAALSLALELSKDKNLKHGGLEIIFTRDEEQNMSGIHNVRMNEINSEYVLVLDADKLGQILISGASFTKLTINVEALIGGHSGIDICDEKRLNAVKLIAEIIDTIPQGCYKSDEYGVVTSINAGALVGGAVQSALDKLSSGEKVGSDSVEYILHNSMVNIINTRAGIIYSVRSTDTEMEKDLIGLVENVVEDFNKKYQNLAKAFLTKEVHLLPFEKSDDETIIKIAQIAAKKCGITPQVASFHAGAETHIYANNCNKFGKKFKPALIGAADVFNMHSSDEKLDYKTLLKGCEFVKEFFIEFNR